MFSIGELLHGMIQNRAVQLDLIAIAENCFLEDEQLCAFTHIVQMSLMIVQQSCIIEEKEEALFTTRQNERSQTTEIVNENKKEDEEEKEEEDAALTWFLYTNESSPDTQNEANTLPQNSESSMERELQETFDSLFPIVPSRYYSFSE